ncbi:MAG: hypothetical protein DWQ36_13865 [Acidobacteria bacterium]|nr:MAG: hypothetical protein DWQ30_20090 [Acidobacteriota bacterium]REK06294.1 MAG: hypothetical protein DWQ36_13865 [Acidobacteriota bacterium]
MQPAFFVICVNRQGYEASLEIRKVYRAVPDEAASKRSMTRVIDESGEDYLYPSSFFVPIEVPEEAQEAFAAAS